MDFIGEYLRKERERQGLSVEEVAQSTKIKDCFISAMEEERFESLPSPFYVKSFLRIYAEFLGLDPNDVLNRFHQDRNDLSVKPPEIPPFLAPQEKKRTLSNLLLFVFGVVLVAALLISLTV